MKFILTTLTLLTISQACQYREWGQWLPVPNTAKMDSGFVDGKMEYVWTITVSRDRVCVDSAGKKVGK